MTIKEALIGELDELSVGETTLEKAIADQGLSHTAEYVPANHAKLIDMALIAVYRKVLARPDVTEGGYSVRWTKDGLQTAIKALYDKWGMSDPAIPKIRSVNVW